MLEGNVHLASMRVLTITVLALSCGDPETKPVEPPARTEPPVVAVDAGIEGGWRTESTRSAVRGLAGPDCVKKDLACEPGTTAQLIWNGTAEQCTRADGTADGPGHGATYQDVQHTRPESFICWHMKANKFEGAKREYWTSGIIKREENYLAGEKTLREIVIGNDGVKIETSEDGTTTAYDANGRKKYAGKMVGEPHKRRRDGTWTRWFENANKQFECTYVMGVVSGTCTAWDETGKVRAKATYADGRVVDGNDVGAFFFDREAPIVGVRAAPKETVDLEALLAHCEAFDRQPIRVRGVVEAVSTCPTCPAGAVCKPCFGDHFVLGHGGKRIAVMQRREKLPQPGPAIVEVAGMVSWGRGSYVLGPCMVRAN